MRLADVWTEAAHLTQALAATELHNARKAASALEARVADMAARKLLELANAFLLLAQGETRDDVTEVVPADILDDGPTEPQ